MRAISLSNFFLCATALTAHLLHLISLWGKIPGTVFLMYSGDSPSQSGPKELLFLVPALAILLWLVILFIRTKKEKFNYINLTEDNKELQYKAMDTMMVSIQILSFIGLISINESLLRDALSIDSELYTTIGLILIILCTAPPITLAIWSITAFKKR